MTRHSPAGPFEGLGRDLKHAARVAFRRPGFSLAVVLTLAVGIGGNTALFALVDSVILGALPYADSERLYSVFEQDRSGELRLPSYPTFEDWESRSDAFEGLAYARGARLTYQTSDQSGQFIGAFVSSAFFETLGVGPEVGRGLLPDDYLPGAPLTAVISHRAWQTWFGGDPSVVGSSVSLDGRTFTLVGIMPSSFAYPDWGIENDLWMPVTQLTPAGLVTLDQRGFHADSRVVARLAPGRTPAQARAEMDLIATSLAEAYPETSSGWTEFSMVGLRESEVDGIAGRLYLLWAGVACVLLLCCLNLANLYTVHGRSRAREYAIRTAIGAGHLRLVRQVMAETVTLAAVGGTVGVVFASWALARARDGALAELPRVQEVGLSAGSILFAGGLSLVVALLFALAATTGRRESSLGESLRSVRSGIHRPVLFAVQSAQIGVTYVLLIGATLLGATFFNLSRVDPGYDPSGLVSIAINPPSPVYDEEAAAVDLYGRLLEAVASLPGVEGAALTNHGPGGAAGVESLAMVGGVPERGSQDAFPVTYRTVSAGYHEVVRQPMVAGRGFTDADLVGGEGPIIINEALASRWGQESAMGQSLGVLKAASTRADFGEALVGRVIGVVADLDLSETGGRAQPTVYVPFSHTPWALADVIARIRPTGGPSQNELREAIWSVEPAIPLIGPLAGIRNLEESRSAARSTERLSAGLIGLFALVALALATIGMYGVISYTVSLQARSISVRLALGATPKGVSASMVRAVALVAAAGLAAGVVASMALSRFASGFLFGIDPIAVPVYATVAALVFFVAIAAGYVPATRAGRMDPANVLRAD